jgi:menaquinone-specific isochorismate synthase
LLLDKEKFLEFIPKTKPPKSGPGSILSYTQNIGHQEFLALQKILKSKQNFFYWSFPKEKYSFISCERIFQKASLSNEEYNKISGSVITNRKQELDSKHPLFVAGVKFPSAKCEPIWSDFKSSKWIIPKIMLLKIDDEYYLTINVKLPAADINQYIEEIENLLTPNGTPDNQVITHSKKTVEKSEGKIEEWTGQINSALKTISEGKVKKIVLARIAEIQFENQPDISPILQQLENNYNNCYIFALKENKSIFFGASPERLFKIKNGFVEIDSLAGSINRGKDEESDRALENTLLKDDKNLQEHKNVLDFIISQLSPLSEKILFDSKPLIKKFSNIQHLHSRVRSRLKKGATVFSLFEKIYPTPAVCGYPKNKALEHINSLEKFERGLYAGAVGWLNKNNCEFAVGIRSAILSINKLRCYAGCGIVNGSDPVSEFNETALKLKPILSLFENETFS